MGFMGSSRFEHTIKPVLSKSSFCGDERRPPMAGSNLTL